MLRLPDFSAITRTLGQRNFRLYMAGGSVSLIGTWVQRLSTSWLTWELTHSFVWLGIISFAQLFPTVVLAPLAGAITDRGDRRRIAIVVQCFACLQAAILAALLFADVIDIWSLLALATFEGAVQSFSTAVRLAIFPALVEREYVATAIATNSAMFNLARFVGPAVGGLLIARFGISWAFALNAVTYFAFIAALIRIRLLRIETGRKRPATLIADVKEGFGYAMRHPGIAPALLVIIAVGIGIKGYPELLSGYVDEVLGRGVTAFAQLTAASGIGATAAAIWVAQRGRMAGLTRISLVAVIASALAMIVFAATESYPLLLAALFVVGAGVTMVGTAIQSLMQNAVTGEMRGRVMSLYGVIFRGGPALGSLAMGLAADAIGMRTTFAVAALGTLAAGFVIMRRRKAMVRALECAPADDQARP